MPSVATLAFLRTEVRRRADMESASSATFVTDAELNNLVNGSLAELHDELITSFQDYFTVVGPNVTVGTSPNTIALPADFLKLRRLQRELGAGVWDKVHQFNTEDWERLNTTTAFTASGRPTRWYRIFETTLFLLPEADASGTYRLVYAKRFPRLTIDTDAFDDLQGWYEFAVWDAAIKCLVKEESDVSAHVAMREAVRARIRVAAAARNAGAAERVADVRGPTYADDWDVWG